MGHRMLSPVTAVLLGAALALVGNMATNTLEVSWRWWPWAVWTAVGLLMAGSLWMEVTRSRTGADLYVARVDDIDDPIRLGVHPSVAVNHDRVPPFVERDRTADVHAALRAGGFILLVGDSTAGKTRLAYESMRACLPRHHCVQPATPDALPAAIAAAQRRRPSVLWLDDLERFLGMDGLNRAAVAALISRKCLILATIRARERDDLSARHDPQRGSQDRQAARSGRDVLAAVDREIRLERRWSDDEVARAGAFADDARIARALTSADGYGLAEVMAAGPQLLTEWRDACSAASGRRSAGAALVTAAIDVRRAGYHRPAPLTMLRELHTAYLDAMGGAALRPETWNDAFAWATQPLYATSSLLQPAGNDCYLAFDYLVDAVASDDSAPPIPAVTWCALVDFAEPADLVEVIWQASAAGRVDDVPIAVRRALDAGQWRAAAEMAVCLGEAGHETEAVALLKTVTDQAAASGDTPAEDLLDMRQRMIWQMGEKTAGLGDPGRALPLIRKVAEEATAMLGAQHPSTLNIQLNLARQLGGSGEHRAALELAQAVATLAAGRFGTDEHLTLSARFEVAVWTREAQGAAAAVPLYRDLMTSAGIDDSLALACAWNLGGSLIEAGEPGAAVPILEEAVRGNAKAWGPRHPNTLQTRATLVQAVHEAGQREQAAQQAAALVADLREALGEEHPVTRDIVASLPV